MGGWWVGERCDVGGWWGGEGAVCIVLIFSRTKERKGNKKEGRRTWVETFI